MLLARLRWSVFGLRGRIVGAVVATAAISLGVAALVLLPQLENSLKNASKKTLINEVFAAEKSGDIHYIADIPYWIIPEAETARPKSKEAVAAQTAANDLNAALQGLQNPLGAISVTMIGDIVAQGNGEVIGRHPETLDDTSDVQFAFQHN